MLVYNWIPTSGPIYVSTPPPPHGDRSVPIRGQGWGGAPFPTRIYTSAMYASPIATVFGFKSCENVLSAWPLSDPQVLCYDSYIQLLDIASLGCDGTYSNIGRLQKNIVVQKVTQHLHRLCYFSQVLDSCGILVLFIVSDVLITSDPSLSSILHKLNEQNLQHDIFENLGSHQLIQAASHFTSLIYSLLSQLKYSCSEPAVKLETAEPNGLLNARRGKGGGGRCVSRG